MNLVDSRYGQFGLVQDMIATAGVIRQFSPQSAQPVADSANRTSRLLLTGEGSSRIFPAKNAIATARGRGDRVQLHTEAGRQAQEYSLANWSILGASNSGRTAEVIQLFTSLQKKNHAELFSLTAAPNSTLESLARWGYVLSCGKETAVAATKSVVEQALFVRSVIDLAAKASSIQPRLGRLSEQFTSALTMPIPGDVIDRLADARMIFFAGRNNGVAEELTLKTNEITRKPADFLEGTYAAHGIEEIMQADDVVVWVDPYEDSIAKFQDVLVKGVGLGVVAISSRPTPFPTITIPDSGDLGPFVQLAAGWNLLVEIGIQLDINIDKPQRARKVGNEFVG